MGRKFYPIPKHKRRGARPLYDDLEEEAPVDYDDEAWHQRVRKETEAYYA